MKKNPFDIFSLHYDKEEFSTVIGGIESGVAFRGTNLWILIFAIFVASLGLNVNSPAVIIGAMLISPLMGPIMGMGLGIGISDTGMLRKSISNYATATLVALVTSTVFFLLSPLNDAHSEILARTSPTIYDVLIALFGGFAGIIATSSRQKGNVIPGVAIATALMPPLCTAGYGLATWQMKFFVGAFYLFIINTVFIALATLITVRFLHFPYRKQDTGHSLVASRIAWVIVILTLIPSIYFGYDLVQQNRFEKNANRFITSEAQFKDDYLLNKKVNAANKSIHLVYGGKKISDQEIAEIKKQLPRYGLGMATLEVSQGFAYLADTKENKPDPQLLQLTDALQEKQKQSDSLARQEELAAKTFAEIKAQYPFIHSVILQPTVERTDSTTSKSYIVWLASGRRVGTEDRQRLDAWLKVRLQQPNIKLIIQP